MHYSISLIYYCIARKNNKSQKFINKKQQIQKINREYHILFSLFEVLQMMMLMMSQLCNVVDLLFFHLFPVATNRTKLLLSVLSINLLVKSFNLVSITLSSLILSGFCWYLSVSSNIQLMYCGQTFHQNDCNYLASILQ